MREIEVCLYVCMLLASDPHFRWKLISLLYSKASVFIKVLHHMLLEEKNRSQNNKNRFN